MVDITASMVKALRDKSGVGMMDSKKALVENEGNIEQAIDWLRAKGLAKAEKKSTRTAAEGLVAIAIEGNKGAIVEINSETDFVARNEEFQTFVKKVAEVALTVNNIEELADKNIDGAKSVQESLTELIVTIGENMALRRFCKLEVNKGVVSSYVHGELSAGLGKIGVLVALESDADTDVLETLGSQLAMHIAATNPQALDKDSVDADVLERERAVLKEQAIASGKSPEIAEKMVDGRLRKFYEEICLLEQTFVIDGETKIADVIANAAKNSGTDIKLVDYACIKLGEGIEKEEEDFASEVAKVANG